MKILITGGSGFVGARAARRYETGHEVCAPGHGQMDFTDREPVMRTFDTFRPEAVFHCGAVSDTRACELDEKRSHRINVEGAGIIAAACREYGAKLIFCSSDQVYAQSAEEKPHKEAESLYSLRPYARQKLEAEQICADRNPGTVSLRLSWMYSRDTDLSREHANLAATLKAALSAGTAPAYPVFDYRSITNVWEVVDNLQKALTLPPGVYNFGSENDKSTYEVALKMMEAMGIRDGWILEDRTSFAGNPRNLRMDISKIKAFGIGFLSTMEGIAAAFEN